MGLRGAAKVAGVLLRILSHTIIVYGVEHRKISCGAGHGYLVSDLPCATSVTPTILGSARKASPMHMCIHEVVLVAHSATR